MKEKNDDEQSFDEFEDEPNLHGMPETLSLLKNFRSKLKDDEIRRRELKKKVFESESTQTVSQNTNFGTQTMPQTFAKISPQMLLKLIFMLMGLLAFVVIFVWYLSAFLNGRKSNDLSNVLLKEKMSEIKDLDNQIRECRNHNQNLLRELDIIEKKMAATNPATSSIETWSWATSMVQEWFLDFYSRMKFTLPESDYSSTKSENIYSTLAVGVMNAYLAASLVFEFLQWMRYIIRIDRQPVLMIPFLIICFLFSILIHSANSSVQISYLLSCVSFFVMLILSIFIGS